MQLRTFENSDPPLLCEIWRSYRQMRGKLKSLSPAVLEKMILSKPYFDPQGLFLALDDERPIGFVHAGFGIADDTAGLDQKRGVLAQLMYADGRDDVAQALLDAAENYCRNRGSTTIEFGGHFPNSPFYLGLYSGSRAVGTLVDDDPLAELLRQQGYQEMGDIRINHWRLGEFRQPVDRNQVIIGRTFTLENVSESQPQSWLQACNYDSVLQRIYQLKEKRSQEVVGRVAFWEMEPLAEDWGSNGMGLVELFVEIPWRRRGLATYLVGESLRQLKQAGVGMVEIQHISDDVAVQTLCRKLGFTPVDSTHRWHKSLTP